MTHVPDGHVIEVDAQGREKEGVRQFRLCSIEDWLLFPYGFRTTSFGVFLIACWKHLILAEREGFEPSKGF